MNRRNLINGALFGVSALSLRPAWTFAAIAADIAVPIRALEKRHGGRLGVSILDTANGHRVAYRGSERFLMCSTFKALAVTAVLARVDRGAERLERRVVFSEEALLSYAPITRLRVGAPGMTVAELCEAAITVSDNTAANVLLASLGGPAAVTAFVRGLGDAITRLDRTEPDLNVGSAGDIRDTTTPDAMLATLQKVLLGHVLADVSRERLLTWLRATSTGMNRLRAGLPAGWTAGDKTGSGSHAETNDVAIFFPPQRKPLLVTAYYAESTADAATRSGVLAEVGRFAASI